MTRRSAAGRTTAGGRWTPARVAVTAMTVVTASVAHGLNAMNLPHRPNWTDCQWFQDTDVDVHHEQYGPAFERASVGLVPFALAGPPRLENGSMTSADRGVGSIAALGA